ncbi:phosphatase PAP2 family protein [Vibrio agarivorans]|uniref:undecaprenyl-diphosphate phosphatase n=1 Tax=Vibrio agarivorans TaxID=153622 RepID=A0ABT7Y737_9VIBR|nr:phosphatase PAP2 family protein [Vibrio agarivorans]MDN2483559.1 phosphatase PAP2 family protein [Vibrio agarivorans]
MQGKKYGLIMVVALLVLLVPITLLIRSVDLTSPVFDSFGLFITLLTDSAGHKGFLITLAVLGVAMLRLPLSREAVLAKGLQLAVILLIGFASKTALKELTESPRPYTEYLAQAELIDSAENFYHLSAPQRDEVIENASHHVSTWRTLHWQGEKDYSFPSGHTIFVAICVAFFGGLFLQHRHWASLAILMTWAGGVCYSRLWIGMHRPEDLFASTAFVALVYIVTPSFPKIARLLVPYVPIRLFSQR